MYSPDGRWWWNGTEWTPAPTWRTRYEATPWTSRLQIAVLALQVIALVFAAVTFPTVYDSMLAGNMPTNGNAALANDPQALQAFRQVLLVALVIAIAFSLVILAIVVVGVLKLWRWLFWYLMITYGIAVLSIPINLIYAFGNGPIHYPSWYFFGSLPVGLAEGALCVWMVIALRRYGAWARRKVVEQA